MIYAINIIIERMNFLNCGYIPKCSSSIWRNSCCLDPKVTSQYYYKNEKLKDTVKINSKIGQRLIFQCKSRMSGKPFGLMLWTQVRFQKDYPKLHRDIEHPNFDDYRKDKFKDLTNTTWHAGYEKQGYTYTVGFFGLLCGMYCVKAQLIHYLSSMCAPADVIALASIEIDIKNIAPGTCSSYKWRGKPLFVKHRTVAEISAEATTPLSVLRDPETPEQRTQKPEWLIVIGICTHLGCVPVPNSGDWTGGFYCPCHGSHYDNVGRARKGPAPTNLEVPPYKFITDTTVLVG